ncbi:MAG: hypothetical protein FJ095_15150 [Deltaproteobacteria bacterium]|nr:hypothetical protein [Deltaproteobacteria bacterium]
MPRQSKLVSSGPSPDPRTVGPQTPPSIGAWSLGAKALDAVRHALSSRLTSSTEPRREALAGIGSWGDVRRSSVFLGRWVALDNVRYEAGHVAAGDVLDADTDLAALCARVQRDDGAPCEIVYCDPNTGRAQRPGLG